jgi:hypothetical protein
MALVYHDGQLAIQEEAGTRTVADRLANWVGPVGPFSLAADMFLLALADTAGIPRFTVLTGQPPLVELLGEATLRLRLSGACAPAPAGPVRVGGLAINLSDMRRARTNGTLTPDARALVLEASETFTLCRKYMAPSLALAEQAHTGPTGREPVALDDPWLHTLLAGAETSFLASISPEGGPDVAHRGGPPGFITLDAASGTLSWPEYLGDGVFKSAGNVRATSVLTLLVLDLETGDGVEISGNGGYTNVVTDRRRVDALIQHKDPYPVQGVITCSVTEANRLTAVVHPRRRIEKALKVTSRSTVAEQAPR